MCDTTRITQHGRLMTPIEITIGPVTLRAELNESATAQATRWGDEFYFGIPVHLAEADDARAEVAVGTLAYWPPGNAFCIFFGPTPVSRGQEPRAYSPVNVVGHVVEDVAVLKKIQSGAPVRITTVDS